MNPKKFFYVMIGVVIVLVALGISGVVISDKLLKEHSSKLVELKLESRLLQEQQSALIQANKDIEEYADLEKVAKSIVPQDKDQARTVREIVQFAEASGVNLKTISFPSSNLGQAAPKPAVGGAEGQPTPPPTSPLSQVQPVSGIPGLYSMEITVQSVDSNAASYVGFVDFLNRLERNRRTAQVNNISIKPGAANDIQSFSLILNVFIKP